ncbi:MAG TPA: hypothetical protein IAB44_16575 [Candidatus Limivivens intestinipullorum]|uniref:Uncharacterized protein n=1 Tax=Candidatus Limivivens intestinipullorum TaxID=2840858 RepID=A0A9D1JLU1_9FIRM|nr:hypothetical protein [Candidatus Limivivens intestinipullorum]
MMNETGGILDAGAAFWYNQGETSQKSSHADRFRASVQEKRFVPGQIPAWIFREGEEE